MDPLFTFGCLTVSNAGDPIGSTFAVEISPDVLVATFAKHLCKTGPKSVTSVPPADLILWKLAPFLSSRPHQALFETVKRLKLDHAASQVSNAEMLDPMSAVGDYFQTNPTGKHIHVLVQLPAISPAPAKTISPSNSNNSNLFDGRPTNRPKYDGMGSQSDVHPDLTFGVTVRRLGPNEVTRANQIVFKLYDSLWGSKMDWTSITKSVEEIVPYCNGAEDVLDNESEEVPDIIMKEPELPSTACLVDIKELIGWTGKDDERETLLCPCFLVRDEYRELDNYLSENPSGNHVLVLGRPGIGKTIYLTHCLLRRLIAGLPTIFSTSPKRCYLFQESGVYSIPYDSFEFSQNPDFVRQGKDSLALFDFNEEAQLNTLSGFRHFRLLVVSSPNSKRYHSWKKQHLPKRFIMKMWGWAEVYHARSLATVKTDVKTLRLGFMNYGGCAGVLFQMTHLEVELLISTAIANCKDIRDLFPNNDQFRNETTHVLVEINPQVASDGSLNREYISGRIATPYIFKTLLHHMQQDLANSMQATFRALFKENATRSASGVLFEGAGHRYIRSLFSQPLTIYPLPQDVTNPISVDLSHVKDVNYFDPATIDELDPINYHQPLSSSLPGIDAFVIECDDKKVPTGIIAFQFTTSTTHPISSKFLQKLWISGAPKIKWKLIFVVPDQVKPEFGAQPWKPTSVEKKWKRRVEQYVLGVDTSKLWNI